MLQIGDIANDRGVDEGQNGSRQRYLGAWIGLNHPETDESGLQGHQYEGEKLCRARISGQESNDASRPVPLTDLALSGRGKRTTLVEQWYRWYKRSGASSKKMAEGPSDSIDCSKSSVKSKPLRQGLDTTGPKERSRAGEQRICVNGLRRVSLATFIVIVSARSGQCCYEVDFETAAKVPAIGGKD